MSSISSIGGASQVGSSSGSKRNAHMDGVDQGLISYLSAQNVSADDQSKIVSEVKEGMATAPGTRKLNLSSLQDMVKKVLDKHGLNGDDFVSKVLTPTSKTGGTDAASSDGSPTAGSTSSDQAANATDDASSTSDDSDISSIIQKLLAMFGQSNSNNGNGSTQSGSFNANATLFDMIDVQA